MAFLYRPVDGSAPDWFHFILHASLIWGPLFLLVVLIFIAARARVRKFGNANAQDVEVLAVDLISLGFQPTLFRQILRYTRQQQVWLVVGGLAAMPVLYATLELPKQIINNVLNSDHPPQMYWQGFSLTATEHLLLLCALYLLAIIVNGIVKYFLNVYKGRVGERLLRRLRLTSYRVWRSRVRTRPRSELIPLVAQEVEPIGGFAADAFSLPAFQGGTFATIIVFMFVQDAALAGAALIMLPLQIVLIPRLQMRVNRLARERVAEVRALSNTLGQTEERSSRTKNLVEISEVAKSLKRIEVIRMNIYRSKFFIKMLNNFLMSLTPFFFFSIGGYLVIDGQLTLGALVAVLAAYKDFSTPLRELLSYYQRKEDARIRYLDLLVVLDDNHAARNSSQMPYQCGRIDRA